MSMAQIGKRVASLFTDLKVLWNDTELSPVLRSHLANVWFELGTIQVACQLDLPGFEKQSKRRGTEDECMAFAASLGLPTDDGFWFWEKCEGCNWTNNGKAIFDWQMTMRAWKRKGDIFPSQTDARARNNGKPPEASLQQKIMNEKIQRAEKTLSKLGL